MQHHSRQNKTGFTIVELLIVIVVIGILAAITIVAYNGIQQRASDTRLRTTAAQLEKAITLWSAETNLPPQSGWSSTVAFNGSTSPSCNGGTGGWLYKGAYVCTLEEMLLDKQLIPAGLITGAPKNEEYGTPTGGAYSYMIYACTPANRYALYYYLKNPTAEDTANLTSIEASGCPTSPRVTYKMKAAKLISVQ